MGLGTLIAGPVSDALGRKPVLIVCAAIYAGRRWPVLSLAPAWRCCLLPGSCRASVPPAPASVGMAMVRDLYKGRDMARIVSFVMMIFMLVPAVAPLMGQGILLFGRLADDLCCVFWSFRW